MNSCMASALLACTPPLMTLAKGTGMTTLSRPARLAKWRYSGTLDAAAPALATAMDTARIALAPSDDLFGVPSISHIAASRRACGQENRGPGVAGARAATTQARRARRPPHLLRHVKALELGRQHAVDRRHGAQDCGRRQRRRAVATKRGEGERRGARARPPRTHRPCRRSAWRRRRAARQPRGCPCSRQTARPRETGPCPCTRRPAPAKGGVGTSSRKQQSHPRRGRARTSTVGLPRLSMISRATSLRIVDAARDGLRGGGGGGGEAERGREVAARERGE